MKSEHVRKVVFARIFEDEDLLEAVKQRTLQSGITTGILLLIGTLKAAVLGFYSEGKYLPIKISESLEILSCMGNISTREGGETVVHAHLTVSDVNGKAYGGHLLPGCITAATAELTLIDVADAGLKRKLDPKTSLFLWDQEPPKQ